VSRGSAHSCHPCGRDAADHRATASRISRTLEPSKPCQGGTPGSPEELGAAPGLLDAELLDRARKARTGDRFRALYDAGSLDAYGGEAPCRAEWLRGL
jgi:hypothetical protein